MDNSFFVKQTNSTNDLLKSLLSEEKLSEGFLVYTDFQSTGKGQAGNRWESEKGKNLLFSLLLYPTHIRIEEHFILPQIISLAIKKVLDSYTNDVTIKWPNDIYWKDKKIGGILIENSIQGRSLKSSIIGIGLNLNQKEFSKNIPNPISLFQTTHQTINREDLLREIRDEIICLYNNTSNYNKIQQAYFDALFRKNGLHKYKSDEGVFIATIKSVQTNGMIELETRNGKTKQFYFKEVEFLSD